MALITNQHKDFAQWAMDTSLKNGCEFSRVSLVVSNNNSFEYRNQQLDKLHRSSENKLFLEFFVDDRYGTFSTNRLDKAEIESSIKDAIASTRFLSPDKCRQLPDSARYYQSQKSDTLDLYDASYFDYTPDQKLDLAKSTVEEIYGTDSRIVSVASSYDDGCGAEYMIASNGFEGEEFDSAFSLTAEVALKADGDARPESYWYDSKIYWTDLQTQGIAKKALDRTLQKLGQTKIKSGKYNLLLDNTVSMRMLAPLLGAMYGTAIQQKNTFLLDRLGDKIVSNKLTVLDSPHLKRCFGARWYDGEGVATQNTSIIENGVLNMYFIDTYNALKMNVKPTIASPSIVQLKHGTMNHSQLLKAMGNGVWVTAFNGGNTNTSTGDFSFGIEGFWIENGIAIQPIGEMNITGNILDLWNNLLEIGNDPLSSSSSRQIPALLFENVNFSGL